MRRPFRCRDRRRQLHRSHSDTPPKESLKLTVALPTSVSFPGSVRIGISDTDASPLDLAWRRCLPNACFADAPARDDVIRAWKSGAETAQITFTDGAGREIKLPFSLRGFAQALEALNKG